MENDYIVLQVRLNSKRLPGKLILPLKGGTIFKHVLTRLLAAKTPKGVIIATTGDTEPVIKKTAGEHKASIIVGSENDVLSRFVKAVRAFGIGNVIRATGDNPLVCIEYIDRALELHKAEGSDLTTYPDLPYGTGIEVIRGGLLIDIDRLTADPYEREHVTQYIYRNEINYRIIRGAPVPYLSRPDIKLTVDTQDDYDRMADIYEKLYRGVPIKLQEVIYYLDKGLVKSNGESAG
jgi:spore coat polysaccharide biosynthesis protein SpsF